MLSTPSLLAASLYNAWTARDVFYMKKLSSGYNSTATQLAASYSLTEKAAYTASKSFSATACFYAVDRLFPAMAAQLGLPASGLIHVVTKITIGWLLADVISLSVATNVTRAPLWIERNLPREIVIGSKVAASAMSEEIGQMFAQLYRLIQGAGR